MWVSKIMSQSAEQRSACRRHAHHRPYGCFSAIAHLGVTLGLIVPFLTLQLLVNNGEYRSLGWVSIQQKKNSC